MGDDFTVRIEIVSAGMIGVFMGVDQDEKIIYFELSGNYFK
jgi:hypothetical protein